MVSSERNLAISSAEFAVRVGLIQGVLLRTVFFGFMDIDVAYHFLVVTVTPTRPMKVLLYVAPVRLQMEFKFSATEDLKISV